MASCLMLVPVVPYAGALLPVNMAMITTRNIEYLIFIVALIFVIRAKRYLSFQFLLSTVLFGLLFISDKLFFSVGLLASILALIFYGTLHRWKSIGLVVAWVWTTIAGALVAFLLALLINGLKLTGLVSANGAGPYGLVDNLKDFVIGAVYSVMSLFTNMGANPAFNQLQLSKIPHSFISGLTSPQGFSYIINISITIIAVFTVVILLKASSNIKNKVFDRDNYAILALMLSWSLISCLILFVATKHYYAVDARYLGIVPFALFIAMAYHFKDQALSSKQFILFSTVLIISTLLGVFGFMNLYNNNNQVTHETSKRNKNIADVLKSRNTANLVGDYWRVVPVKQELNSKINVIPHQACNVDSSTLSSKAWLRNLDTNSFAYLVTVQGNLTNYKDCTINQVVKNYGKPNASALISGTLETPKELVLFYDGGKNIKTNNKKKTTTLATVIPISIDELPNTQCIGPTVINVVAHQDDDLLFINPNVSKDIKKGNCVRTNLFNGGRCRSSRFLLCIQRAGCTSRL
jgi:hypothetical protein